ncbi:MAG TPA: NADH-quinone oxidoreductase subunit J [Pyrinomonadaceae bacterium]|nr:NADH-quinone oxidoreductase subunit J [Pyrinomonadaceae bacterium]
MVLSGWEAVFFWVFGLAALVAGLLTIMARNAVHSALFLISALVSVAALFVLLGAEFIAGVQILVYVGGVMVLFLFVIMLVNVSAEEREEERLFNRTPQVAAAVVFCALLGFGLISVISRAAGQFAPQGEVGLSLEERAAAQRRARAAREAALPPAETGVSKISRDTQSVGASLFRYAGLPFEIASVLLLVAIVGSVLLARTAKQELAADDLDPELLPELARAEPELLTKAEELARQGRGPAAAEEV